MRHLPAHHRLTPLKRTIIRTRKSQLVLPGFLAAFTALGLAMLTRSQAATYSASVELEDGAPTGKYSMVASDTASGKKAIKFGTTTTPPPGSVPNPIPTTAKLLFNDAFDSGTLSKWGCQSVYQNGDCKLGHYSVGLVGGGQQAQGTGAVRFEERDGDEPDFGGERTEIFDDSGPILTHEGDERWYQWSTKFDGSFPNPTGGWFLILQWHSGSGSPPMGINVENNGDVVVGGDGAGAGKKVIGKLQKDKWVQYTLHVKFSNDSSVGYVEAWEDGVQKIPKWSRKTMSSSENYFKMGIYRDPDSSGTSIVYDDDFRVYQP